MPSPGTDEAKVKTKWQIEVDPSRCIGAGSCISMARQYFMFDRERHSKARQEVIEPDPVVLNAALSCPVDAIKIVEIDGDRTKLLAG